VISFTLLFPRDRRALWQGTHFLVLQKLSNAHVSVVSHTMIYAFYRVSTGEWQMRSVPCSREPFLPPQKSEITILWGKIILFITWNSNALLFSQLKSSVLSSFQVRTIGDRWMVGLGHPVGFFQPCWFYDSMSLSALANCNDQSAHFCLETSYSFILSLSLFFSSILGRDRNWKAEIGSSGLSLLNCLISPSKNAQGKMDGKLQARYKVLRVLQKWCSHLKGRLGIICFFIWHPPKNVCISQLA